MEGKKPKNHIPKAPRPKYAGSIRKYYKKKEEKSQEEWYFLCGCGKKGINYYDYRPCIQCDVCKVWKHVKCVGFSEDVTKLSNQMRKRRVWVCSDCKSGNFKYIAKIWLKDELLNNQIDQVKRQIRSLSSSDDYTKTNQENEEFERNLAKKKSERNKILIRKPTAFDEEYEKAVDEIYDQIEANDNDDDDEDEYEKERKEEKEEKEEKEVVKIEELTNTHKKVKSKSNMKSSKPPLLSYKSYIYSKSPRKVEKEKENNNNNKNNANNNNENNNEKVNENEPLEKHEEIIVGKISFIEDVVNISLENSGNQPHHLEVISAKPILKMPTPKFDDGPSLTSISEYRNDPDNLVFKENSKQRIVRAGRNLIRTFTVY